MWQGKEYKLTFGCIRNFTHIIITKSCIANRNLLSQIMLVLLLHVVLAKIAFAQTLIIDNKKFFEEEQFIEMTLVTDLKKLIGEKLEKGYQTNFQPATVTCHFFFMIHLQWFKVHDQGIDGQSLKAKNVQCCMKFFHAPWKSSV